MIYYPIPLSRQTAYRHYPAAPTPVSDMLAKDVIALPMHPYLDEAAQDTIIQAVLECVG
jgi:dTDP-4-amino-4,6-dideoxygalactose transaminase